MRAEDIDFVDELIFTLPTHLVGLRKLVTIRYVGYSDDTDDISRIRVYFKDIFNAHINANYESTIMTSNAETSNNMGTVASVSNNTQIHIPLRNQNNPDANHIASPFNITLGRILIPSSITCNIEGILPNGNINPSIGKFFLALEIN